MKLFIGYALLIPALFSVTACLAGDFTVDELRLVTVFESKDCDVYFGYMEPSGWFLLNRPADGTWQEGNLEEERYAGKIFDDGRIELYYRRDGKLYLTTEGMIDKNGDIKLSNKDGSYSYGFIDNQDHIQTPYKGGWNNMNAITDYDNYSSL